MIKRNYLVTIEQPDGTPPMESGTIADGLAAFLQLVPEGQELWVVSVAEVKNHAMRLVTGPRASPKTAGTVGNAEREQR